MNSLTLNALILNGGKGSGNFGHGGRPGMVGSSGNGKGGSSKSSDKDNTGSKKSSGAGSKSKVAKDLDDAYKTLCPGGAGSHPSNILDGTEVKKEFDHIKEIDDEISKTEDLVDRAEKGDKAALKELRSKEDYRNLTTAYDEELEEMQNSWQETYESEIGDQEEEPHEIASAFAKIDESLESLRDRAAKAEERAWEVAGDILGGDD